MKTDISPVSVDLYFIPVQTRVPLKFGPETLTSVICARACVTVANGRGQKARGWGETPLSVQWAWPSSLGYQERCDAMQRFCSAEGGLAEAWARLDRQGHPIELGNYFIESILPGLLEQFNRKRGEQAEPMPHLAALVCCSAFDVALHDAYGKLLSRDVYSTYNGDFMNMDLSCFLKPAEGSDV
jgi:L-alanine-DL-glutamate epimerase-like enolase superfamily enzyme